ncbi:MAG TPA: NUDIX hydrolase [Flavobacterium sp.]|nr:NUDIX hydrolase [Flavobacterium sp.]
MNFNVRVYSFFEHQGKILLIKEPFQGNLVTKLPGGGLEFGEGTKECLIREFKEELNLTIEIKEHIYTLDYFLRSKRAKDEQLLFVYYKVEAEDITQLKILVPEIQELIWIEVEKMNEDDLSLEADKSALKQFLQNQR